MGKLTAKQEKFCLLYAKTGNATQSYKDAGYKASEGSYRTLACRLLMNVDVKERISELQKEYKDSAIADIKEMQELLTKIVREELDEEVLMVEGDGEGYSHVVKKRRLASIDQRLKAMDKLLRMQGAFIEKIEVNGNVPVILSGDDQLED